MQKQAHIEIVIAVCTRQRPIMLQQCLSSLIKQHTPQNAPASYSLNILIVENDLVNNSESIVAAAKTNSPFPIHYCLETDIGIAQARNRALKEAKKLGCEWLWFLDDDGSADAHCLKELLHTACTHNADIVQGRVVYQYPATDRWAHLIDHSRGEADNGKSLDSAATNNVLFSSRLFNSDDMGLNFDAVLGLSGGEDTLFFKQALKRGATAVFASRAVVYEVVPESRCTLQALFERQARKAASAVYIDKIINGNVGATQKHYRRLRQNIVQVIAKLILTLLISGWFVISCRPSKARFYFLTLTLKIATLRGRWRGLHGKLYTSYNVVHGY